MTDRTAPPSLVLVQDLVNTFDAEAGQDALATPEGLAGFLREHGLPSATEGGAGAEEGLRELREFRALREALRAACLAHAGPDVPPDQAAALARLLSAAPLVLHIAADGSAAPRPAEGLRGVAAVTARIAVGIADAAADGSWQRLKACQSDTCRWVFYDRSPGGRGRWCTMATCGSRAKMRNYRARQQRGGSGARGRDGAGAGDGGGATA